MTITVKIAADRLALSVEAIHKYIRQGRLKAAKIGRDWQIEEADLSKLTRRAYTRHGTALAEKGSTCEP